MNSIILIFLCVASIWAVPTERKPVPITIHHGGRIIGGDVAKTSQFPWQVAIYRVTNDGTFFCGGALVGLAWVLTSASCVYNARSFTMQFGSNSLTTTDANRVTTGAIYFLTSFYDPNTLQNDISIVRMDTTLTLNDFIQTIPIATTPLDDNAVVSIAGWGASSDSGTVVNDLTYVNLTTIPNADCQSYYSANISDGMLCAAGVTTQGICGGDNGNALISIDSDGNAFHVGIASFTSTRGCENSDPSGFTRTSAYADWITDFVY